MCITGYVTFSVRMRSLAMSMQIASLSIFLWCEHACEKKEDTIGETRKNSVFVLLSVQRMYTCAYRAVDSLRTLHSLKCICLP